MKNEKVEKVMPNFGKKMAQPEAHVWKVGDGDAAFIESKIGMTIAVDIQDREEHFTILDLKMYHQECEGGLIEIHEKDGYQFKCKRCEVSRAIAGSDADKEGMMDVVLKGAKYRTLSTQPDIVVFEPRSD
jgi:hypothetical protein